MAPRPIPRPAAVEVLRALDDAALRRFASEASFRRGCEYARRGSVRAIAITADGVTGTVHGSEIDAYRATVVVSGNQVAEAYCSCPFGSEGWCKHLVATVLGLRAGTVAPAGSPAPPRKPPPARRENERRPAPPPFERARVRREIRAVLRSTDGLRASEAYWHVGGVTDELGEVIERAETRRRAGDRGGAFAELTLLTAELEGAFELLDDSDGEVGDLLTTVADTWIRFLLDETLPAPFRLQWRQTLRDAHDDFRDYGLEEPFAAAVFAAVHAWEGDGSTYLVAQKLAILETSGRDDDYLALARRSGAKVSFALKLIERGRLDEAERALRRAKLSDDVAAEVARAFAAAGDADRAIAIAHAALRRPATRVIFRDEARDRLTLARWLADLAEHGGARAVAHDALLVALRAWPTRHDVAHLTRLVGIDGARETALQILGGSDPRDPAEAIAILLQLGDVAAAMRLVDKRPNVGDERSLMRVAEAAIPVAPAWTIDLACRRARWEIGRAKGESYRRAAGWLRIAARAFRAGGRDDEWITYRAGLLETYRSRRNLVPLIQTID